MKKSLLLVGAFLTVAAMAQAKEVVPAPVVVTEPAGEPPRTSSPTSIPHLRTTSFSRRRSG